MTESRDAFQTHFLHMIGTREDISLEEWTDIKPCQQMKEVRQALEVYRVDYWARLTDILRETFEACARMLGESLFVGCCHQYLLRCRSQSYDLSRFGHAFPRYLKKMPVVKFDYPYLVDLARFEWLFKDLFHQKQHLAVSRDEIQEALITGGDFVLTFGDAVQLFQGVQGVYDLWYQRKNDTMTTSSLDCAKQEHLLVFKYHQKIHVKSLARSEYALVSLLKSGTSFLESVTHLEQSKLIIQESEIHQCLQFLIKHQVISSIHLV